jgi:hypothetical protein
MVSVLRLVVDLDDRDTFAGPDTPDSKASTCTYIERAESFLTIMEYPPETEFGGKTQLGDN